MTRRSQPPATSARAGQPGGGVAPRALRGLARRLPWEWRHIIAVPPWQLRLPPRLAHGIEVRALGPADTGALTALRPCNGLSYGERFELRHLALGAWLEQRLVAFVWVARGPARLPSSFGCSWELSATMAWLYDLYSDPDVLGAISHLYGHLRRHPPGGGLEWLVGQADHRNHRSRLAHRSLGYMECASLFTLRAGRWRGHVSRAAGSRPRWRGHRHGALIPLHLFLAPLARMPLAPAAAAPLPPEGFYLQCACGEPVAMSGTEFRCRCGRRRGARRDGVHEVGEPMPYWGELAQQPMRQLLRRAEDAGWRQAVAELAPPQLFDYVANPARAAFQDVIPLLPGARILDVGAGWGGIAAPLARAHPVLALEGVPERARFLALRKQQDRLEKLEILQANLHATVLAPRQFDFIVVNGFLEWVALLDHAASPRAVQLAFLYRLRELLAPGGRIYLGIENRLGWPALKGGLDHSGLPYTGLMPRWLARLRCAHSRHYRAQFNVGYRTYTYSHGGYRRLFAEAGLNLAQTWVCAHGYNRPDKMVPLLEGAIALGQSPSPHAWRHRLKRQLSSRPVAWKWLGADFAFLLEAASASTPLARPLAHPAAAHQEAADA